MLKNKGYILGIFALFISLYLHPIVSYANELPLKTEASILVEANTGTVLYENNSTEIKYPASVTKIATAIYAIEHAELLDMVTVSKNARYTDGTRVYLEMGETVTLEKLLYGLLINSGNDAAVAIAEHVSGSEAQFAHDMTNYFKDKLHIINTNFTNASGLFDANHYTTAYDLSQILLYAMKNETFMQIFGAKELRWIGQSWDTTIVSHHRMVNGEIAYEGITGGKNGFVPEAKYTLATTAQRGNMHLIAITLGGTKNTIYSDTIKLLNYGFDNFELQSIPTKTKFEQTSHTYINLEPIEFYVDNNESYSTQIQSNGILNILNDQDKIIKTIQLKDTSIKKDAKVIAKSAIEPVLHNEEDPKYNMLAGLLIVVLISIFFFSKVK